MRYAALLRGVNVGKSVKVPMSLLKTLVLELGCSDVVTYLNSGNVIVDSELSAYELESRIEERLEKLTGQTIPVLVKSSAELALISHSIPDEWRNDSVQKSDVAYLFKEIDTEKTLEHLPVRREFIDVRYVKGALLWNVCRENYNKSRINTIVGSPLYNKMTIRNSNTARQLARLANQLP